MLLLADVEIFEDTTYNIHNIRIADFECPLSSFHCHKSGICVNIKLVCNGLGDCLYGEDEDDCPNYIPKFECGDKLIDFREVCDYKRDCTNGEDEKNCGTNRFT